MLALLVPGTNMGGSPADAPVGGDDHFLAIMGVGRILIPFLWIRGWLGV